MTDLTVKRTLVKSPPELWSELSEADSLHRHLGEFGEIRITKLEPETTVAWEGERASGTVEIEASGWGTKVTLTAAVVEAEKEPPEAPTADEAHPADERHSSQPEPAASEPVAELSPRVDPEPEPEPATPLTTATAAAPPREAVAAIPEHQPHSPAHDLRPQLRAPRSAPPRKGFFARILGRGRAPEPPRPVWQPPTPPPAWTPPKTAPEPSPATAAPEPTTVGAGPASRPVADVPASPEPPPQSPEPVSMTERRPAPGTEQEARSPRLDPERALAVLEGTLDTLGAAHHRPFSRD